MQSVNTAEPPRTSSRPRDVLTLLVRRDLAVKYQDSTLGYLWSLLEPLGMALTYWFVFGLLYGDKASPRRCTWWSASSPGCGRSRR